MNNCLHLNTKLIVTEAFAMHEVTEIRCVHCNLKLDNQRLNENIIDNG